MTSKWYASMADAGNGNLCVLVLAEGAVAEVLGVGSVTGGLAGVAASFKEVRECGREADGSSVHEQKIWDYI